MDHLWDVAEWQIHIMDEEPTNLQHVHDTIIYNKINFPITISLKIISNWFLNFIRLDLYCTAW